VNQPQSRARRPASHRRNAPGSGRSHSFSASIEALSLATDSLPARVRDLLARGIRAVAQAVKEQWALLTAAPVRQLPPPRPGEADAEERST